MKQVNKIGILVSWPREIDMYDRLLSTSSDKYEIIANDFKSFEKGRNLSNKKIIQILDKKKIKYSLFSNVYKKNKYSIILSTGEISGYKISLYSTVRFLYAITIGSFLKFFKISKLLINIFGRPFDGGGIDAKLGAVWLPEKILGKTVIKFPDGMDVKTKNYPFNIYKNVFDIYFSYCDLEIKLIESKFQKKCVKIDYFRFNEHNNNNKFKKENLIKEFKLNPQKKIIYWMPTYINNFNEENENLKNWIHKINFLNNYYNVVLKPHPKTLSTNKKFLDQLKKLNYVLDENFDKKIMECILSADLILADYGSIPFDTIFLKKKLVLLNLRKNTLFEKDLIYNESLDILLRNDVQNLNIDLSETEILKKINIKMIKNDSQDLNNLKIKYYGKKIYLNFYETKKFLDNKLNILDSIK